MLKVTPWDWGLKAGFWPPFSGYHIWTAPSITYLFPFGAWKSLEKGDRERTWVSEED